ncbi:MAG: hypothetical protein P9X22_08905 [Candidatus Zapsychrus exili]|nr:hypothetical protein [Candidatus Zapsychrus exili]
MKTKDETIDIRMQDIIDLSESIMKEASRINDITNEIYSHHRISNLILTADSIRAIAQNVSSEYCAWRHNGFYFETQCQKTFSFDSPKQLYDCHIEYCPFCGKKIIIKEVKS